MTPPVEILELSAFHDGVNIRKESSDASGIFGELSGIGRNQENERPDCFVARLA